MSELFNTTHPSNSTYCPEVAPFWASATDGETYNITIPGNPPFGVHSRQVWIVTQSDSADMMQSTGPELGNIAWDLNSNTFSWTPVVQAGAGERPPTEGNETDFRAAAEAGDSLIWVFTEREEINVDSGTPENRVWVSGNFTVRTEEMIQNGELEDQEDDQVENGSLTGKHISLKSIAVTSMLVFALAGLSV